MLPANCRYYPSCSEYSIWQFKFNSLEKAILSSTLRILRCNQLFQGGIDYPVVEWKRPREIELINYKLHLKKKHYRFNPYNFKFQFFLVEYWLIPKSDKKGYFFVVKDLDGTKIGIE